MPRPFHFLRCVGRAVAKNGARALARLVPFGEVALDIAIDTYEEYRRDHTEADLRAELEKVAQAGQAEVRHAAEAVAALEAADQSAEVRQALAAYLAQLPVSIRQSLRRPADPGGITVPAGLPLRKPDDLLPFLPTGLPRFKPGDRPLAADWELVELLGRGGFGEVWKARHLTRSRQKPVALKFCLDPVAAATLRNEAALHDQLDRVREEASAPGIVPLLETYLRSDPPCLMYEFIEGGDLGSLAKEMQARNRLNPSFATWIIHRLALIIAGAHRLNPPLVHRDLKMSNVLVRRKTGGLPNLFVADFGIGGLAAGQVLREQAERQLPRSQLLPTAIRGAYTRLYASPQQIQGKPPDPRDDVHALGVLWYQLCTGDLSMLSISPDWRDVVEERGLGEEPLTRLLAACIASRPEKRPVNASDLAEKLGPLARLYQVAFQAGYSLSKTKRAASQAKPQVPLPGQASLASGASQSLSSSEQMPHDQDNQGTADMVELLAKWRRASARLQEELGRPPTQEELARSLNVPPSKLNIIKEAIRLSGTAELQQVLDLLEKLENRQAAVLRMRFGLGDEAPIGLEEIGKCLGLASEQVSQIETQALNNLSELLAEASDGEARLATTLEDAGRHDKLTLTNQILKGDPALDRPFTATAHLTPQENAILAKPLSELSLSRRARKCLGRAGIACLGDLASLSVDELLETRNFGMMCLNEVREKLAPFGLTLRGD
jgi:serine/threonine protein kinase